jgi:hypothetical protein
VTKPPDLEAALSILRTDSSLVEYVVFLVDAERLYEAALGMYDFELVLLVAQHAQKVTKNYSRTTMTIAHAHGNIGSKGIFTILAGVASSRRALSAFQN